MPTSLERLTVVFAEMAHNQLDQAGRLMLGELAARGAGGVLSADELAALCPSGPHQTLEQLLRRELLEPYPGGYRFRIEFCQRWYAGQPQACA